MAGKGNVHAHTLKSLDQIEVPVEVCEIVSITKVHGQLKNRKNYLIEFKVRPISGPWANCEGVFIMESDDPVPLVKKFSDNERRKQKILACLRNFWSRLVQPRAVPIPSLPAPTLGGPMT